MKTVNRRANTADRTSSEAIVFPSNIVPEDPEKLEKWMHDWADGIITFGQPCFQAKDDANFNCANGIVNADDFRHITDLVVAKPNSGAGYQRSLPAKLRPVNVVDHVIRKMVGRVVSEGFQFSAQVCDESAVSQKLEDLSAEAAKKLTLLMRQQGGVSEILGRPLHEGDDVEPVVPEQVQQMSMDTFQQQNEEMITRGLRYLMKKQNLFIPYKMVQQGLRNYSITGKMAWDTYIEIDPTLMTIYPNQLIYDLYANNPFIHYGRYAGYTWTSSPQELIDHCPELEEEEIKTIETMYQTMVAAGSLNRPGYYHNWNGQTRVFNFTPYKLYWKGLKKEKVKVTPNWSDEDNPHITFVGDECEKCQGTGEWNSPEGRKRKCSVCKGTGKVTEEVKGDEKIEHRYFTTVYECTKITESIYYQCREMPGQHRSKDEPSEVQLPIVGIVDPNPTLVDIIRPLQELRIECFFTIERLIGQAKGNIIFVDEAGGQDVYGQLYNMLSYGIHVRDSSLEGADRRPGGSEPTVRDMGMSQAVTDMIRMVAFIDQNIDIATGGNDASRGVVKSDQTTGVTQNAVLQSQLTLAPYYDNFYTASEMALQALCNLMRPAWSGKTKTAYFMGDNGSEFLNLHPEQKWDQADYAIFVQNSVGANKNKEFMLSVAQAALPIQKDPNYAVTLISMAKANGDVEAERIFKAGVEGMNKLKQATDAQAQKNTEAQLQAKQMADKQDYEVEMQKAKAPVDAKTIDVQGKMALLDKKLTHQEDSEIVAFKNEIALKSAEILAEKEKNKIQQPEEQHAQ